MLRSMTAFASAESDSGHGTLAIELRSVNHRYLELGLRLPDELRSLEPIVRERVATRLARGKVDLGLRWKPAAADASTIAIDQDRVARLAEAAHALGAKFPEMRVEFTSLLAWPGVLLDRDTDLESLREAALAVLDAALDDMVAAREREGERLGGFLRERLDGIERLVAEVRAHLPEVRTALRARFDARLAELKQPLDPGRIEQEVVLQLQRIDVDEELDRLTAHVAEARRIFGLKEAVGRRLDFLMQEFNREANTLGSKAADPRTTKAAVELKVLIEQMREQIQNLE
ncbi:YicC/YloC family endoribonuclease [Dokdonella sp.]|uniref:YicC/YloC family endoribonuclease n=1 Tax=Dokdonella sp. TaxID=2291710 RepID=UPI001B1675C6|nr:YicC/YloC family endoribonuclease [Dokdonella sp.]MBO9664307.1 YicC family protein [Dokdonella sp.]